MCRQLASFGFIALDSLPAHVQSARYAIGKFPDSRARQSRCYSVKPPAPRFPPKEGSMSFFLSIGCRFIICPMGDRLEDAYPRCPEAPQPQLPRRLEQFAAWQIPPICSMLRPDEALS